GAHRSAARGSAIRLHLCGRSRRPGIQRRPRSVEARRACRDTEVRPHAAAAFEVAVGRRGCRAGPRDVATCRARSGAIDVMPAKFLPRLYRAIVDGLVLLPRTGVLVSDAFSLCGIVLPVAVLDIVPELLVVADERVVAVDVDVDVAAAPVGIAP